MDILVRAVIACVQFVVYYFVHKFIYTIFLDEQDREDPVNNFFSYALAVPTTMAIIFLMFLGISLFHWVLFGGQ